MSFSFLKLANIFFQFFFIRFAIYEEKVIEDYYLISFDLMNDVNCSSRGYGNIVTRYWYIIQYWVIPLTGWNTDNLYSKNKLKHIKIWKKIQ